MSAINTHHAASAPGMYNSAALPNAETIYPVYNQLSNMRLIQTKDWPMLEAFHLAHRCLVGAHEVCIATPALVLD